MQKIYRKVKASFRPESQPSHGLDVAEKSLKNRFLDSAALRSE